MSDVDSKESVHVWEQVVYDNLCTHLSILVLPEISLKKKTGNTIPNLYDKV